MQPEPAKTEPMFFKATNVADQEADQGGDQGGGAFGDVKIQEEVLNQLLCSPLEFVQDDKAQDQPQQFSSSDTVNELLKEFAAASPQESTQMLSMETEDILPTFSRVLKEYSSQGLYFTLSPHHMLVGWLVVYVNVNISVINIICT